MTDRVRRKIKIVFFVSSMEAGGAERVLMTIIKNIDRQRFIPALVLFSKRGSLLSELPEDVEVYSLKELRGRYWYGFQWLNLLIQTYKHLKGILPDVVLSFMWYPNAVSIMTRLAGRLNCRLVISERTSTFAYDGKLANLLRSTVLRFLYPKATLIIAPSKGIADNLASGHTIKKEKITVIHNPVDITTIKGMAGEYLSGGRLSGRRNIIVGIGRLGQEKGFDNLVKAVALLIKEEIDCELVILGEGGERPKLEAAAHDAGIADKVYMPGFQQNPYKYLANSAVFVLSSLFEGFPNVLLEALALGIPSVATRCPTGPEEIITDGIDGILVPPADEYALAEAIKRLLSDAELRERLGEAGRKRAEDFEVGKIVRQYEEAIEQACAESAEN